MSVGYVKERERGTAWVGVCAGYVRRKRGEGQILWLCVYAT